ncbi:glycosyltransferase [Clostridium sp. P21]|uniref:Glycosyltransferase n=1 Tax=Clostridium muellerianum TaxID=2716538 RepID=A0A7Y0ED60_9CLOT|nr:glycosyltransferase family 2 protein [Clostridium muellerianum]NMM61280.1 glycosyltransferase [Clostridium muellerianum]
MDNLSVVIRNSKKEIIKDYVRMLKPILENYNVQICILSNDIEKIDIEYNYLITEIDYSVKDVYKFYESVSSNEKYIILEEGIELNESLCKILANVLLKEDSINYYIPKKRYVDVDNLFVQSEFIYRVKGKEEALELDGVVNDFSLMNLSKDQLEINLTKMVNDKKTQYIHEWYSLIYNNIDKDILMDFYNTIEKIKLYVSKEENDLIETLFLSNKLDKRYCDFLAIKRNLVNKNKNKNFIELLKKNKFLQHKHIEYSIYILYYSILSGFMIDELLEYIGVNRLKDYIMYMFSADEDFYAYLFAYIMSINIEVELGIPDNKRIIKYFNIVKSYLIYMNDKSSTKEKRKMLVQVFVEYTNYSFYVLNEAKQMEEGNIEAKEMDFIKDISSAILFLNNNNLKDGIDSLESASLKIDYMILPVRYYIQSIIRENKSYYYKLSICLIVKNEEKHIERCLKSVKFLLDESLAEVIIVDTGSSDKTVDIASIYTDKVYFYKWNGDFSKARNYSFAMAKGEYIFVLDADEEFDKASQDEFLKLFRGNRYTEFNTFSFKEKNYLSNDFKISSTFTRYFIFKNEEDFYFTGKIHEQPVLKEKISSLNMYILHYGYIMDSEIIQKKFERNLKILKEELGNNPNNEYYMFQMATTYRMHGDIDEGIFWMEKLLNRIEDKEFIQMYLTYYNEANTLYLLKCEFDKAIECCKKGLKKQEDFIDLIYGLGTAYFLKEDYENAYKYLKNYLKLHVEFYTHEIANNPRFIFISLDQKDKAINSLLVCCYMKENYDELIEYYYEVLDPNLLKSTTGLLIEYCFNTENYNELSKIYKNKISNNNDINMETIFYYFIKRRFDDMKINSKRKLLESFKNTYVYENLKNNVTESRENLLIKLIDIYDIEQSDIITSCLLIGDILDMVKSYNIKNKSLKELINYKKYVKFAILRTITVKQFKGLREDQLLDIINKYIEVCLVIIESGNTNLLDNKENKFINKFIIAFNKLQSGKIVEAIKYIKESAEEYNEMARPMELFIKNLVKN